MAPPDIQTISLDHDRDGVLDQYNITLRYKKSKKSLKMQQMNVILAFDYQLQDMINLKMEGLVVM